MTEGNGNGLEMQAGPAKLKASGDRSMIAVFFLITIIVFFGGFYYMRVDHAELARAVDRLTIATITTDEDKRSAVGPRLREELRDELTKAAEKAVEKANK